MHAWGCAGGPYQIVAVWFDLGRLHGGAVGLDRKLGGEEAHPAAGKEVLFKSTDSRGSNPSVPTLLQRPSDSMHTPEL